MFTCVFGFYLSYLGYFALPAVGPRYTLHDFNSLDAETARALADPRAPLVRELGRVHPDGREQCGCDGGHAAGRLPERSHDDDRSC